MGGNLARTSLCIVRVERSGRAALVRVKRIPDLEAPWRASSDAVADVDAALALVRAFLEEALT
jgi:hypothetical protein